MRPYHNVDDSPRVRRRDCRRREEEEEDKRDGLRKKKVRMAMRTVETKKTLDSIS